MRYKELPVSENSSLVGVSLKDSGIRHSHNLNVLSIIEEDGDMLFNPPADTKFRAGEKVIAVGTMRDLKRMEELLNP